MCCKSPTSHCPKVVQWWIAEVPLPTALTQCGSVLQEIHYPLPQGTTAVYNKSSIAHCPQAVR